MMKYVRERLRLYQTRFSFGSTAAIITNLSLITGLDTLANAKLSIIGGILVIAIADNISDSVGIHIYQESECLNTREVWISTFTNFISRIFVSFTFILIVFFLPLGAAVTSSIIWGLTLLSIISYSIARAKGANPFATIFKHMSIALPVIAASSFVGRWLISKF